MNLITKLQQDSINSSASVIDLLRTTKLMAVKLNIKSGVNWIDRELDGYNESAKDLPEYRRLVGVPKVWNPYHGWQTINFPNEKLSKFFSLAPLGQALGAVESGLGETDGTYTMPYDDDRRIRLLKSLNIKTDVTIFLSYGQLRNVVDSVRNLILNWSLELEKAGIIGADMSFSDVEKDKATAVSTQYFIQNVGVLGNVADQARVINKQSARVKLDYHRIVDFIEQARKVQSMLPQGIHQEVEECLKAAEESVKTDDDGVIRNALNSVRSVCEQAAGNIAADGIIKMISDILQ